MTLIRVAIVENHPLYRRGLIELLAEQTDIAVAWTAATVPEAQECLHDEQAWPQVILLDRHLPGGGPQGADAVAALVAVGLRVLVISATDAATAVADAFRAGASGYVSKDAGERELVEAIHCVHNGGKYSSPSLPAGRTGALGSAATLSPREVEVVRLIVRGDSDAAIGQQLGISKKTVQSHLDRIQGKTGMRNRRKLALWALGLGIVAPDDK